MPDYLVKITTKAQGKIAEDIITERLVRAKNEARSIAHVVKDSIVVTKATTDEVIRVTGAGIKLEQAE